MTKTTFKETQRFDQWWLRLLLLAVLLIPLVPFAIDWTENGISNDYFWTQFAILATTFLVVFLLFALKLETTIDRQGIHYRFFPLINKQKNILWSEISKCYVTTYNPITDFGGWGFRISHKGKAYNVKGNKGIQLELKSGKNILFGTQKENEAKNVINHYFEN
tara:strand:+ start:38460 stop:38948 length:489 start_codon:yes stop_codon:yes gene_type:complete